MTEHNNTQHDNREKLWELIKDVRYTMISHLTDTHEIHSQPMTMLNSEQMNERQNLYFILRNTNDLVKAAETGRGQIGLPLQNHQMVFMYRSVLMPRSVLTVF